MGFEVNEGLAVKEYFRRGLNGFSIDIQINTNTAQLLKSAQSASKKYSFLLCCIPNN